MAKKAKNVDPQTGKPMMQGISATVSERTGAVTYRARFQYTNGGGKRIWGGKTFKSYGEAEEFLLETRLRLRRGTYAPEATITCSEYFEIWMGRMSGKWTLSTRTWRRQHWEKHFLPKIGAMPISSIKRALCQQLIDDLVAGGAAPRSVINYAATLSGLFRSAMNDGLIPTNPAAHLTLPTPRRSTPHVWTAAEANRFLQATVDHPHHALYRLLLSTGIRIGEALALRWVNVDLTTGRVIIADTYTRITSGTLGPRQGTKTGGARTVIIPPATIAALERHREDQQRQRQEASMWDIRGFVFTGPDGKYLGSSGVRCRMDRAMAMAGVPRITPHGFRHTAATLLLKEGVHPRVVQEMLGHASIRTTMDIYSHVSEGMQRSASAILDHAIAAALVEPTDGDNTTTLPVKSAI